MVVLHEHRVDTRGGVGQRVVRLHEESSIITEHFWSNDFDSRELSVDYLHDDCVLLCVKFRDSPANVGDFRKYLSRGQSRSSHSNTNPSSANQDARLKSTKLASRI